MYYSKFVIVIDYVNIMFYFRNVLSYEIQKKIIEELEDWKEKQMILFNEKVIILKNV